MEFWWLRRDRQEKSSLVWAATLFGRHNIWAGTETYFGSPASMASSASIMDAPGSFSEGFSTKVFPVVHAMGNIQRGIMAGKLKGQMPAHTCPA